ncbi:MAG: flagellar protein export ATPase FliI [Armatimonadota bacterium]
MAKQPQLTRYSRLLQQLELNKMYGRVEEAVGLLVQSSGPPVRIGEICRIRTSSSSQPMLAEVVGFRGERVMLMPMGDLSGIQPGSVVEATGRSLQIPVGPGLVGRILDGLGRPIDGKGEIQAEEWRDVNAYPPLPTERRREYFPMPLGIRAIDGLLTCASGQRIGIFAGSGVGKSTLLGMMARNAASDVNVIGLIGERGREALDFVEKDLGPEGLARSVLVVATSDQPAVCRLKGAFVAFAIAEYFRDQGKNVLLMMDSVTRFAWAQREIGLSAGEPPTTRGYTPSVFALLPRLLERAGIAERGTITGLFTVLVDGDDMNEPVADAVRSILDGHIVLSRKLAARNHYPAISVLDSVSRLMPEVASPEHRAAASDIRDMLSVYTDAEDMINIGAYVSGSNPKIDRAVRKIDQINAFLKQETHEHCDFNETIEMMMSIAGD